MWFDGNQADAWKSFKSSYGFYQQAMGIDKKSEKVRCSILLHVIGKDAQEVYQSLHFEDSEKDQFDVLIKKFDDVFLPKVNIAYERFRFNTAVQKAGQLYDSYFTELRNLASSCDFGVIKDSLIRDRIIVGINSRHLQERLLQADDLTLKKAMEICKASEIAQAQAADIKHTETDSDKAVEKVRAESSSFSPNQPQIQRRGGQRFNRGARSRTDNEQCTYCGMTHNRGQCPAYGKSCDKCGANNHFARVCRSRNVNLVDEYEHEPMDENFQSMFIGVVNNSSKDDEHGWKESVIVNNHPVTYKLDSGAQANTMSMTSFQSIKGNVKKISRSNVRLFSYCGHKIIPVGSIKLPCYIRNKLYNIEFQITREDLPDLLGQKVCEVTGLVKRMNILQTTLDKATVLKKFTDMFNGEIGCLPETHKIVLRENCKPVINPPRRVTETLKAVIIKELKHLEEIGIIKAVDEPTEWVNSMVIVSKPDGGIRICMDAENLNDAIIPSKYKLKTIEEVASSIPGAKVFSKVDGFKGFWQILLDEESSKLCTFNTPIGRYRFTRLPFGICDASEIYQKLMEKHFGDIANVIVDDILVSGVTQEEHDRKMLEVLNCWFYFKRMNHFLCLSNLEKNLNKPYNGKVLVYIIFLIISLLEL